jgi:PTH1 family peptidyl-tRNA hydrolase
VGLGNPGKKYSDTRHNAGAWFVEDLARSVNVTLRHEAKYHGLYSISTLHGQTCHLLVPTTYMNLSGRSVSACMSYLKLGPQSVLIAHDEIDLPPGTIKLKFDGGDGGNNGVKDIIAHLNTKQFYRLRIGVGHPGNSKEVVNYVLQPPSKIDKTKIHDALTQVYEVLPMVLSGEVQKAMNRLHTKNNDELSHK